MRISVTLGLLLITCALGPDSGYAETHNAEGVSSKAAIDRLRTGNQAYVLGKLDSSHWTVSRRVEVSTGQTPFASVLTCADSRVPPELIFNQGLGDLFVVRIAGNVSARAALGSLEYAAEHLGSRLVVVMGHTACGAVKAALGAPAPAKLEPAQLNLESLLSAIRPALNRPVTEKSDPVTEAVYSNVEQAIQDTLKDSPVLAELVRSKKIAIVGAVYHLDTGRVKFSEPISLAGH